MSRTTIASLLAAALLTGCGDSPEAAKARKELGEAMDASKAYAESAQHQLMQAFSSKLDSFDSRIQQLREQAAAQSSDLKIKLQEQLKGLEAKAASSRDALKQLNANKGDAWDTLKAGLDSTMGDLGKTLDEVAAQLKK